MRKFVDGCFDLTSSLFILFLLACFCVAACSTNAPGSHRAAGIQAEAEPEPPPPPQPKYEIVLYYPGGGWDKYYCFKEPRCMEEFELGTGPVATQAVEFTETDGCRHWTTAQVKVTELK